MNSRHPLEILDICDLVAATLTRNDLLVLSLVSRRCHAASLPRIWRRVNITQATCVDSFAEALPRHGHLIRDVRIKGWIGHKHFPTRLRQYCPNIISLSVVDYALPEENRVFVDTESGPPECMFNALRSLELYLNSRECQQFLFQCLRSIEAGQDRWARLQSLEITLATEWQGSDTILFSIRDFLRAFPRCQKMVLHNFSFTGEAEDVNAITRPVASTVEKVNHPFVLRQLLLPLCTMDVPSLASALGQLHQLQAIQLGSYRSHQDIEAIFKALPDCCPDLTSFKMLAAQRSMSNDIWVSLFQSFSNLRGFHIGGSSLDDPTLKVLSRLCRGLEELSLFHSPYVTFRGVQEILASYPCLVLLDLTAVELTSEMFTGPFEWACKSTLRELSINRLHLRAVDHEAVRRRLGQLVSLERLNLCGSDLHVNMMLQPLDYGQEQIQEYEEGAQQVPSQFQEQRFQEGIDGAVAPALQPFFSRLKYIRMECLEPRMTVEQAQRFVTALPRIQEMYMARCFTSAAIAWLGENVPCFGYREPSRMYSEVQK